MWNREASWWGVYWDSSVPVVEEGSGTGAPWSRRILDVHGDRPPAHPTASTGGLANGLGESRSARLAKLAGLGAGALALICSLAGGRAAFLLLLVPGGLLLLLGLWLDRSAQRDATEVANAIGWIAFGLTWGLQ